MGSLFWVSSGFVQAKLLLNILERRFFNDRVSYAMFRWASLFVHKASQLQESSDPPRSSAPGDSGSASPAISHQEPQQQSRIYKLLHVFAVFDLDCSGFIETTELLKLGKARRSLGQKSGEWTEEKNARLVQKMDANGDGVISAAEFSEYFEGALTKQQAGFDAIIEQFLVVANDCRNAKQRGGVSEQRDQPSSYSKVTTCLNVLL